MRVTPVLAVLSGATLILGCDQNTPTSVSESVIPQLGAVAGESWIITTYYWEDGGWVEQAWWNASFLKPDLQVFFMASNWSPNHPEFESSFDNFYAYGDIDQSMPQGLVDDFAGTVIGSIWGGSGGQCVWWQGAAACQDDRVEVYIGSGVENPGDIRRVAGFSTWDYVLHGEFDVRIDFSLDDDFHSKENVYITLAVVDDRERSGSIQLRTGRYESIERGGWGSEDYFKPIRWTPSDDVEGRLRITRTRVRHGGDIIESVTGSGSRHAVEQEGDWRTFSFTAHRHADGTVDGQWQRIRRQDANAADSKSHGVVSCFTIVGDEAWLGGYATSGLHSDRGVAWRVKDNGQGSKADADQISLQWSDTGLGYRWQYCASTPDDLELHDIDAGNIQIKP